MDPQVMELNMEAAFPKVNNKLAFFDFDRTLVSHSYSKEYNMARHNNYLMECVYCLTALKEEHANDRPLPCMQWYTNKLFEDGYGLYCLTHEVFSLRDVMKQEQLKLFYPNSPMTYLTVKSPEAKIEMMKAVAMVECCPLEDVIFVDDQMATVNLALAAGIDAKHLSDIVVMYETSRAFEEQKTELAPKGFMDYMRANPDLVDKISYEQFTAQGTGMPDEDWEKLFRECRQMVDHANTGKPVGSNIKS